MSKAQRGRVPPMGVPEAGLLKGHRPEPSDEPPDVSSFNSDMPSVVTFWRVPEHPVVHHRNPIFDDALGISPEESLVVDQLHALCLGVYKYFLGELVWALLIANVFEIATDSEVASRSLNVIMLRALLFDWYPCELASTFRRFRLRANAHRRIEEQNFRNNQKRANMNSYVF